MSALARPKGRLPARVYWVRRLTAVGLVALLVLGVHQLLTPGSGAGSSESPAAAAPMGAPFDLPSLTVIPTPSSMVIKSQRRAAKLAKPQGPCDPSEVAVAPIVERANIGRPTRIILEFTSTESAACTFEVSADSVAVNISTASAARELLWTTQDCPAALTETSVVAREETPGRAVAVWDGRRSDGRCSKISAFVLPATYLVEAVALGATEPESTEFTLGGPVRPTVTRTVTPTPTPTPTPTSTPTSGGSGSPQ